MKFGQIDSKYDIDYDLPTNQLVVSLDGKELGRRYYRLNYQPRAGFDVSDANEIERLACEVVDSLPA